MTSTDIEAANYWNGIFMSRDRTHQESIIQESAPPSIRWEGLPIPLLDIERMSKSSAMTIDSLNKEAVDRSRDLLQAESELGERRDMQKIQNVENAQSKLDHIKRELEDLKRRLSHLTVMKNHRDGKIVRAPILITGKSRVILRYYGKKPAPAQMLGYLATANARAKCSWEQLRLVAPVAAIKEEGGVTKVQPCPQAVYAVLNERYIKMGTKQQFPPASREGWTPPEISAYAWCMLINAWNRSWGSTGLVNYPKGFQIDRRFAQATKKSVKARKDVASPKARSLDQEASSAIKELLKLVDGKKNPQSINARYMSEIRSHLEHIPKATRPPAGEYSWLALAMSRITAAVSAAHSFLDSHREPSRIDAGVKYLYFESAYVLAQSESLMSDFGCGDIDSALRDWVTWFLCFEHQEIHDSVQGNEETAVADPELTSYTDREFIEVFLTSNYVKRGGIQSSQGKFTVESGVAPVEEKENPEPELPDLSVDKCEICLKGTEWCELHMVEFDFTSDQDEDLEEGEDLAEAIAFSAAEQLSHEECKPPGNPCSWERCPKVSLWDAEQETVPEEILAAEMQQQEDDTPVVRMPTSWQPVSASIPDIIEEDGRIFQRVILDGATMLSPNGMDFLLPKTSAFMSIYRHGRIYVCNSFAVKLPRTSSTYKTTSEQVPQKARDEWSKENRVPVASLRVAVPTYALIEGETGTESSSAPPRSKGKGKAAEVEKAPPKPTPEPKKKPKAKEQTKAKKAGAKSAPSVRTSVPEEFLKQFKEAKGSSPADKDASIDGMSKSDWVSSYVKDAVEKSGDTQTAGCICTQYPCRHTKSNITAKVHSARDVFWNETFHHLKGGKLNTPDDKQEAIKEPLEKGNPLRVKNTPRSAALSEDDRNALKKHFGVPPEMQPDAFKALSKEERNEVRKKGALPHWATALALRDNKYVKQIVSGKITKEKAVEILKQPPPKPRSCATEWSKIKARFDGVLLLEKPRTGKQKALKSAFDRLAEEFPKNPALPKPKKGGKGGEEEKASKPKAKASSGASSSGDSISLETIKAIASLAKLFR